MSATDVTRIGQPDSPASREEIAALLVELQEVVASARNLDMTRAALLFALRQIQRVETLRAPPEKA